MAELTVYSTSSDGKIQCYSGVYATAHGGTGTFIKDVTAEFLGVFNDFFDAGNDFTVMRCFGFWDASAAAGGTVTGVVGSLYGKSGNEDNAGLTDFGFVEGIQNDPLEEGDFASHEVKQTLGHAAYYDYSANFVTNDYNDITFNATGIGWVQAAIDGSVDVKLCIRCRGDIDETQPGGRNYANFYSNEDGDRKPKLVITYDPPAGYTGGNVDGIAAASIGAIDGVPTANIAKVDGV